MNHSLVLTRRIKWITLITCFLAALFWIFFNVSKHDPLLVKAGVFIEDPFDAVGSFGIQLAALASLFSLIRIFLPKIGKSLSNERSGLILRTNALSLASIFVTLFVDMIALLRYHSLWQDASAGWVLAALVAGLLSLTIWMSYWLFRLGRAHAMFSEIRFNWKACSIFLITGLILFFYPATWRVGPAGGIFTALVGMFLFFINTFAIIHSLFPEVGVPSNDIIDDLETIYRWMRTCSGSAEFIFKWVEAVVTVKGFRFFIRKINPRLHPWALLFLIAGGLGLLLAIIEAMGEGIPNRSVILMVLAVFIGIEGTGVLLGYALFNRYLGIFR